MFVRNACVKRGELDMSDDRVGRQDVRHRDDLGHDEWMSLAAREYERLDEVLAGLTPDAWYMPTDCDGWNVRDMVAHLVGAAESNARLREAMHQARVARSMPGKMFVDRLNAVQVSERKDRTPIQLVEDLRSAGQRGVRARRRIPGAVRAIRVPFGPPLGLRSVGYLTDRIYTRDVWMHRIDICRATGAPLHVDAHHDGVLVADVVAEWAAAHGQPIHLTLTGQAGGTWRLPIDTQTRGGTVIELDGIEFCRILSGRASGAGLLAYTVPF
jgi:uncharacterized protein (TIGR03083 family)